MGEDTERTGNPERLMDKHTRAQKNTRTNGHYMSGFCEIHKYKKNHSTGFEPKSLEFKIF